MSDWYWKMIALKSAFIITYLVSYLRAEDTVQKITFCNPVNNNNQPTTNDLVIVSTLDGKLTAFSTQNGQKAWDLDTQPLLSSTLHQVELTSGGKWVRLVPSLRGSLYSLSGDTIEPLPFNADQLLSSSFKYSEDLVIAGAREAQWLGLDVRTGDVLYECGSAGCNGEQTAGDGKDVLVLRVHSSTVRALDPRSGSEKWNFSVAEHNLALSRRECLGSNPAPPAPVALVVGLPDGEIAAQADNGPLLWKQKLASPVANVWRLEAGSLQQVEVLWQVNKMQAPSLYVGVHCGQLYIQESQLYAQSLSSPQALRPLEWKAVDAKVINEETALVPRPDTNLIATGQIDGNQGYFLYLQENCDQAIQVTVDSDQIPPSIGDDNNHHIHVHVYSLWFWWKEVLLIAISSALLMNLMIWPRFFAPKFRPTTPIPLNQEYIVVERHYERPVQNMPEYSGRYENDFTPLRCLGRGGFGVVFEARNNIDHCSYAVKRITLPKRESKRERVLREVRALAKLEHENIVRYFNAWLEAPPAPAASPTFEKDSQSIASEDYTSPYAKPDKDTSVKLNLNRSVDDCEDALDYENQLSEPKRLRSRSCNDSFSIVFDENASKPHLSVSSQHSQTTPHTKITPNSIPKPTAGTSDDSFIVFANTNEQLSEARNNMSINKQLERVKECEFTKEVTSGTSQKKKKKGHTRHWSLDMVVQSSSHSQTKSVTRMYLYIQMQLCLRDNLHDWLRQNRECTDRYLKVKSLFSQIVSAVEYVHLAGLIHRDLKPSNIFFAPDGKVKVGDFGLVTAMTEISQDGPANEAMGHSRHTYKVGTHLYMSPEQLLGRPYSYKVDIFSLGLILLELLVPFSTESERVACLMKARNGMYPSQFECSYPEEIKVLKQMLSEDPATRPSASGVRASAPLFQQTDPQWHYTLPTLIS